MTGALDGLWRIGVTVLALFALAAFWVYVLSHLTPFSTTFSPEDVVLEKRRHERFRVLRRVSVGLDVVFFVWLVVEGAFLVPWMFSRYGIG